MSKSQTHITTETAEIAPHAEESWHTITDQEWKLNRFTSPDWSVDTCEYEDNEHHGAKCTVLRAVLEHVSGARILCKPVDPWEHHPGPKMYRKHRVVVRDPPYGTRDYVVTIQGDEDELPETSADALRERGDDPFNGAHSRFERKGHQKVREMDYTLREKGLKFGKGNTVETLSGPSSGPLASNRVPTSAAKSGSSEARTMSEQREIEKSDLPSGWVVEDRAATWVVSTHHDTEFVYSGGVIRLTPGDAFGASRHVIWSDGADDGAERPGRDTLINRVAIICEILDLAAADRLQTSVTPAIQNAFAHGLKPRQSSGPERDIGQQRKIGTFQR